MTSNKACRLRDRCQEYRPPGIGSQGVSRINGAHALEIGDNAVHASGRPVGRLRQWFGFEFLALIDETICECEAVLSWILVHERRVELYEQ